MENTEGQETQVEIEQEVSNLPSEQKEVVSAREKFIQISDDDFNEKGLFKGRWNNPQEMADYIKHIEDKHANTVREIKNSEKQTEQEIQQQAEELKLQQIRQDTVIELAPQFIENGMKLTDDMIAKLEETGLTETEIKLGAYEYKERFESAYNVVGGKQEYDAMMQWAVDGLTDAEKQEFNKDLGNARVSKLAIEGLYNRYKANNKDDNITRFRGQPSQGAIVGYSSRAELFKDKAFVDSNRATDADRARYRARLRATPDEVWQ